MQVISRLCPLRLSVQLPKRRRQMDERRQLAEAIHRLASETTTRTCGETVQRSSDADEGLATCAVQSWQLHTGAWFWIVHCAAYCLAVEDWKEEGQSVQRVFGIHSEDKTENDSDVDQWCSHCAREAEHHRKARTTKAGMCWTDQTVGLTLADCVKLALKPFQGHQFLLIKTTYVQCCINIIFHSIFSCGLTCFAHLLQSFVVFRRLCYLYCLVKIYSHILLYLV